MKTWAVLVAFAATLFGCAKDEVGPQSASPQPVQHRRVQDLVVPAGTAFTATAEDALGSETSRPGDRFTARVRDPIRDEKGSVVVPAGATLTGHVVAVDSGDHPSITVAFDSIETTHGLAEVDARVTSSGRFVARAPDTSPELAGMESVLAPPGPTLGRGGGPPAEDDRAPIEAAPSKTLVPRGSTIPLVLTRPLSTP